MSVEISGSAIPVLSTGFRLQWESAQGCHVLLYPEGMVQLNGTAAAVLKYVDGVRDIAGIVAGLETDYGQTELMGDVVEFIGTARQHGWLDVC